MALTLASYNGHRAIGRDRRTGPARILGVIGEIDPDVIALQEVEATELVDLGFRKREPRGFLWGRPLRHLHRYFTETPAVPTFPSGRPVFALDRLWAHPGSILRELKPHTGTLARVASDHLPLVARLDVQAVQRPTTPPRRTP